ncbi:MAG TPA: HAMP domain-containing sensor histidine kinase [Streptosporangiaceae bacterium]|nr:HAMP domain-containing sensor histidine kinase [Streptosporangiaceae bacterium]
MFYKTQAKTDRPWAEATGAEFRTLRELCHDLTVPATSIKLLTQVAEAESDPGPSMRARLRQISDEAARIADICGYFLDQPGSGPADLDLLAAEVADSARWRFAGLIDVVAEAVSVAAHPVVVLRILTNLTDNACRAAGPGGRVRLTVQRTGDRARLTVTDSGRGFGQGAAGRASLGLDIVTAMVRRSGGTLQMGTSDLGGVAVTVTLPREASRPSGASHSAGAKEAG